MSNALPIVGVLYIAATALTFLILLVLKVDNHYDVDYTWVALPAPLLYGAGTLFFGQRALLGIYLSHPRPFLAYRIAVAVLSAGSFFTVLALTRKAEFLSDISFTGAMLPFMVAIGVALVLFLLALNPASSKR